MVIIIFGLPLTHAYAMLRQSVADNSTFWGIVFYNLGTPKKLYQISSPHGKLRPHILPHVNMVTTNNVPAGQKNSNTKNNRAQKKDVVTSVLIPF